MHLRHHLPLYLFALLTILHLAVALTTWESIHQVLHTYPLAIDNKDFDLLSKVISIRSSPHLMLPSNKIIAHLPASFVPFLHLSSIPLIPSHDHDRSSPPTASPTTPALSPTLPAYQQSNPL